MRITEKTKYSEFEPLEKCLTADQVRELKDAAVQVFGRGYDLTVDEFFALLSGEFAKLGDLREPTVMQMYWLKYFSEDFLPSFEKTCKAYKSPTTAREIEASSGTYDMTMQEGMLVFLREYFSLPSFAACGSLTLGEYVTARKHRYNCELVQYNMDKIMRRKMKIKG